MLSIAQGAEGRLVNQKLANSLLYATNMMEHVARTMYNANDDVQWQTNVMGYTFSLSRSGCLDHGEGSTTLVNSVKSWLRAHEEAQVMLASVLVVVGLWWLVRTVLALLINLVCPMLVVVLAVVLFALAYVHVIATCLLYLDQ